MSGPDTATRFDAWASTYEHSVLQPTLYVPAQQRALQLVRQLMPRPQRLLDVGCGTGRLLRQARHQYPEALLVGIDTAWGMVASAAATTNAELAIHHVRAAAEQLPFADRTFDLVMATMSLRHWTDPATAIAQIDRVLIPGGALVVADVFPTHQRRGLPAAALRRRGRGPYPTRWHATSRWWSHTPGVGGGLSGPGCVRAMYGSRARRDSIPDPRVRSSRDNSSPLFYLHRW